MTYEQEIAETTIQYLGGYGRLQAMIGAKNFSYNKQGTLTFHFKMFKKANIAEFILKGDDTYTLKLRKYNQRTYDVSDYKEIEGLYFDQLREVFERETGLYLSL